MKLGSGAVIEVNEEVFIDEQYEVYACGVPAGKITELTWFSQTTKPSPKSIKSLIFLGPYKWGVTHLISIEEEFNNLSESDRYDVLTFASNKEQALFEEAYDDH